MSTLTSVHGLRLASAAWKTGAPGAGDGVGRIEELRLDFAHGIREAETELLIGQRNCAMAIGRIDQDGKRRPERGH